MSTQSERIAVLEEQLRAVALENTARISALEDICKALSERLVEAHARIDDASRVFNRLRAATVSALKPRVEPDLPNYIPRAEFDAAVAELRSDAGDDRARFSIPVIRERALARRTLRENTAAAAA